MCGQCASRIVATPRSVRNSTSSRPNRCSGTTAPTGTAPDSAARYQPVGYGGNGYRYSTATVSRTEAALRSPTVPAPPSPGAGGQVDEIVGALVEAAESHVASGVPACQVAIARDGEVVWTQTFGAASETTRFC